MGHIYPKIQSTVAAQGRIGVTLFLWALLMGMLYGQQDFRGAIEGQVKDPTGGAMPGVSVTATLIAQNKSQTVLTNDSGFYSFSSLIPGTYRLKAVMPGFKTYERAEIVLQVNDKLTIDIDLTVGEVAQEIIVRGDSTPLLQQIQNFDQSVDERQIEDLPLNGRNSYLLFGLAAGVLPEGDPTATRPFDNNNTSEFTVGGTGRRTADISLDGGSNTTGTGTIAFIPSAEAIKEFKVTTSAFDASIGNTSGAIINASLKSGGKKYNGSLYQYYRNSAIDANFWDANRQQVPAASAKWNQFGATLGGPLRWPRRPRGQDRTFFFFNFEGIRANRLNHPFIRTLPTELERRGDFSQTTYFDPGSGTFKPVTIYDPDTTYCSNCVDRNGNPDPNGLPPFDPNRPGQRMARQYRRRPFENNTIPLERMNPLSRRLLQFIPLPNRPGDPRSQRDNFIRSGAETDVYDQSIARIDRNLSERQSLFLSFSLSHRTNLPVNWLGNIASPNWGIGTRYSRRVVIGDTYQFGSGMVMNAQYALARYVDHYRQRSIGMDLAAVGFTPEYISKIKQSFIDKEADTAFPDISIDNYIRLGTNGDHVKTSIANDTHEGRFTFTKVRGKHGLRWGFDSRAIRRNEFNFGLPNSRLSFGKSFTHGPNPTAAQRVDAGNEFATFLLGFPTGGFIEQRTTFSIQDLYAGAYIQDDYKLSGRLTINAGLRWEYWFPRTERFDRMTRGFAFERDSPVAAAVRQNLQRTLNDPTNPLPPEVVDALSQMAIKGGLLYAGRDGAPRGQLNAHPFLFAPRLGFAYRLTKKTIVRGGGGLYFEPLTRLDNPHQDGFSARTGYVASITTNQGPVPANSLDDPFPGDLVQPFGASLGLLTSLGQSVSFINPDRRAPRVLRAEFGIQRELPGRIVLNSNYLTTRWNGRPMGLNINDLPDSYLSLGTALLNQAVRNPFYGVLPSNSTIGRNQTIALERLLRPYPEFDGVTTDFNLGRAWYHGLNANISRRFERGFMFQAAYTWSKGMGATSYANVDDRKINKLDRRLLQDHRPHRLVVNGIWELPFGRNRRYFTDGWAAKILGGWQMSGIWSIMSGRAVPFEGNRDYAVQILPSAKLPNGPYYDPQVHRWVWFNREAFRPRRTNELRNVPQYLPDVRVDGYDSIDLRLTRSLPVSERVRMQFIAETFNLTNRVQYGSPNTDIRNVNFGTTASQVNWPRSYQFALRLQF